MATAATRAREADRGQFAAPRAQALEDRLARIMRQAFEAGAIAYAGGLEGPMRHGIRADLCLAGWRWADADRAAVVVVQGALRRVRAVRPTWNEGQPEHVIQPGVLIERTRCVRCHTPLPEGHFKFCGRLCANAYGQRARQLRDAAESTVIWIATRSI